MNQTANAPEFSHRQTPAIGILLINLGTPDAPTAKAVRRYLAEFLADPRVIELPRFLWWVVLHGIILRIRPRLSAKLYKNIWTQQGSPLLKYSVELAQAIEQQLNANYIYKTKVVLAMRYGNPSISTGLKSLRNAGARQILILPLYPQYSATTTASCFDAVSNTLQRWRCLPALRFIDHYHDFPAYINAVANSIRHYWQQYGQGNKLIFSFHGIPQRYFKKGDPYFCECQKTARLVAEALALKPSQWQVCFQSRFGKEPWLQPYTDETLRTLPATGIKHVDIVCPGFACDCLETLEEIAIENRDYFLKSGGEQLHYIPALNSEANHVAAITKLLTINLQGWEIKVDPQTAERAKSMGSKQ